jgi:hypothetical protein
LKVSSSTCCLSRKAEMAGWPQLRKRVSAGRLMASP